MQGLEDHNHPVKPVSVATQDMVNNFPDIVITYRYIYMASTFGFSQERVHFILTEGLEMRKNSHPIRYKAF